MEALIGLGRLDSLVVPGPISVSSYDCCGSSSPYAALYDNAFGFWRLSCISFAGRRRLGDWYGRVSIEMSAAFGGFCWFSVIRLKVKWKYHGVMGVIGMQIAWKGSLRGQLLPGPSIRNKNQF